MYIRSVPPDNVDLEGLVQWLLLEFHALESAFQEQELELQKIKEKQDGI